jgi:hypothetical protein
MLEPSKIVYTPKIDVHCARSLECTHSVNFEVISTRIGTAVVILVKSEIGCSKVCIYINNTVYRNVKIVYLWYLIRSSKIEAVTMIAVSDYTEALVILVPTASKLVLFFCFCV